MAIRAVILDIGGVLEANPRTGWQERWARQLGLPPEAALGALDAVNRAGSLGAISLEVVHERLRASLGITAGCCEALMEDAWAEYVGTLDRELARWFSDLRPRWRTALLSNSFVGARERERAAYDLESLCETVVYSHEVGIMKPDPEIYRIACRRLGVAPAEAVFVDDVPENVAAARRLGMVGVTHRTAAETIATVARLLDGA